MQLFLLSSRSERGSVSVMAGFVWALLGNAQVFRLVLGQLGQFDTKGFQVSCSDLFIQFLVQHEHSNFVLSRVGPQVDLSKNLISKGAAHDKC